MKKLLLMLVLSTFIVLSVPPTFAQYEPSTQISLPDGAIARLGRGHIKEIMYSPDGTRLAVTTSSGVWIYDGKTGEELGLITRRHKHLVMSAAYSPDGKTIATGYWNGTLRLCDADTGKNKNTLIGHSYVIDSIAYSPNGSMIATGGTDKTVRLWDVSTGKNINTLTEHIGPVYSVKFSPDGKTIATGSEDNTIRLWDTHTGKLRNTFDGYRKPIVFSMDGNMFFAVSNSTYEVQIWDTATGQPIKTIPKKNTVYPFVYLLKNNTFTLDDKGELILQNVHTEKPLKSFIDDTQLIVSIIYSPDGKTIATADLNGTMQWWDAHTGENIKTFTRYIGRGHPSIQYSPNGKLIATGGAIMPNLWDAATGKFLRTIYGHESYGIFTFSPDGDILATASADSTARLWNVYTGENIKTLTGHNGRVYPLIYSPDGNTFVTADDGGTLRIWNADTGNQLKTLTGDTYKARWFLYSPDGKKLATRFNDTVRLLNAYTGETEKSLIGHTGRVHAAAYSPNGKTITTYSTDNTVRLWDTNTEKNIKTLNILGKIMVVVYSPEGEPLAITTHEETVTLWNVATEQLLKRYEGQKNGILGSLTRSKKRKNERTRWGPPNHIHTVKYSPNGSTLATVRNNGIVQLWDVDKERRIGKLIKPFKDEPLNVWIEYSPDGRILVTAQFGNMTGTPRLWDTATGKLLKTLKGYTYCGNSLKFSPDSKTIATGHRDGTVLLWDIPTR